MLTKQEEEYLECLIIQAKKKCKEQYSINIEKNIKIDANKSLEETKNLVLQAIKAEKDIKMKEKNNNPDKKIISNTSRDYLKKHEEIEKANMFEKKKKEMEMMNKIMAEINSNIRCDNVDIKNHYERLRKAVELTAKGYMNCCFIQGQGGLGKSFQTTAILNELGLKYGKDYVEFSGDITLAYIYRFIYDNNGKIIIFRDLIRLLNELKGIDLFKAMTETHGTRRISKATYSKEQKDLPPSFEVKSNFIFEFNSMKLNGFKEDLMALFSRGDYVNLVLSVEQIKDIMLKICKNDEEKEITNYLFDNHKFYGYNNLNLRTQQKAFKIYKYAKEHNKNWREELMIFLKSEMSNIKKMLYSYMGNKVFRTTDLKSLLVRTGIDNCYHLRTADRRIREWIMLRELFIVGYISNDDEELEQYINANRNYLVSLNPIEKVELINNKTEKKPILNLA